MISAETNGNRGVLLLNAINSTQYFHCGQSAPYQVDSRPAIRLSNDGSLVGGVLHWKGLKGNVLESSN